MFTLHGSAGPGVNDRERWAAAWMYIGTITIHFVLAPGMLQYVVFEEDRDFEIYKDAREYVVSEESRDSEVALESRKYIILAEDRTKYISG